jgi:hypothetical protein
VNNVVVLTQPADKGDITSYGAPEKLLQDLTFLFGRQVREAGGQLGKTQRNT